MEVKGDRWKGHSFFHFYLLISLQILNVAQEENVLVKDNNLIETSPPVDQEEEELEFDNNSTIPTQSQKSIEVKMNEPFLRRVIDDTNLFPEEGPKGKNHATDPKKAQNKFIFLYLAEIINIECHSDIKCAKYKVGYIIREEFDSSHKSRITHLTPYVNFYWSYYPF